MLFTATTKENLAPRLNGIHLFLCNLILVDIHPIFLLNFLEPNSCFSCLYFFAFCCLLLCFWKNLYVVEKLFKAIKKKRKEQKVCKVDNLRDQGDPLKKCTLVF